MRKTKERVVIDDWGHIELPLYDGKSYGFTPWTLRSSFPSYSHVGFPEVKDFTPLTMASKRVHRHPVPNRDQFNRIVSYDLGGAYSLSYDTWPLEIQLRNRAINKLIEKFRDSSVNMAATFAERQSTIDMIGKRCNQAYTVLRALKRGRLDKAVRILKGGKQPASKDAASLRLEFAYGWAPLVSDIYTLADKEFPPDPEVFLKVAVRESVYHNKQIKYSNYVLNQEISGTVRASAGVIAIMQSPLVASANSIGLVNPALVAWELVPFSFIVDWFLPIGNYIDGLTAFSGYTIKQKYVSSSKVIYSNVNTSLGGSVTTMEKTILRSISPSFTPSLRFKNPISTGHAMNALALIRVLRKD